MYFKKLWDLQGKWVAKEDDNIEELVKPRKLPPKEIVKEFEKMVEKTPIEVKINDKINDKILFKE